MKYAIVFLLGLFLFMQQVLIQSYEELNEELQNELVKCAHLNKL